MKLYESLEKHVEFVWKTNDTLLPCNFIKFSLVVSKIAYKSRTIKKSGLKFFSGTLGISYCSKTCSKRSGLSIAPTPNRFGHVQAKNDTIEKEWITIPPEVPLKENAQVMKLLWQCPPSGPAGQKNLIKSSNLAKKGLSISSTQQCKTGAYSVRAAGAGAALGRAAGLVGFFSIKQKQIELKPNCLSYVLPNQLSRIHNHRTYSKAFSFPSIFPIFPKEFSHFL